MTNKTLGATGARLLSILSQEEQTIFSVADAQRILGASYDAAQKVLRRLTRAGWLVRLAAGSYAIVPLSSGDVPTPQANRYVIARELLGETPYYISHDSAMDIHNMLTRPVTSVYVTTPRRLARRDILGVSYRFVYAPSGALWGSEPVWVTPYERVTVSDLERTILDGLARPDLCAGVGQVATGLWMRHDDLDWGRLADYALKLGTRAVAQRLGYLLELYGLGAPASIERLQGLVGSAYARLDPLLPDDGPYLARWRLRLNLEADTLQSIVRT